MKVVILGPAHPLRGGLAAYNERLAQEFIAQGHEVIVYTFSLQYPGFLFPGTTQYSDQHAPTGLNIKIKVNSINPLNWIIVGREIKKLNADLLITRYWLPFMGPCLGTINRIARSNKKTKVISLLDNIIPHEKRPGDNVLTNYFVKSVDGFIAMSQSVLDDLNTFNKTKPRLFNPHPVYDQFGDAVTKEEALKHLGLKTGIPYLLFFGFIRDYKGLDLLLKAMADERIKNSEIKLIVAGEFYSDRKVYDNLIAELQLSDHVIMKTDYIPDNEVRYYFCASDMVVQPYKHATQSGVTQICYHFNRPMLVTNVGGLPEIVPHNVVGYVTQPDPADIAKHIQQFYIERKENVFAENIKTEKKRFSWPALVNNFFTIAGLTK
ncbi:MAG: glycosyltransferase [Bacteroidia bacterium]